MLSSRCFFLFLIGLTPFFGYAQEEKEDLEFSVMVWNIWHGGKSESIGRDGVEDVIAIIEASESDIILMIETYGSGKRVADALGYHYHLIAKPGTVLDDPAINLSIISRFPFGERVDFYNYFNVGGIEIQLSEQEKILVFDTWLNYQPWHDQPHLMEKSSEELVGWERSGIRTKEVGTILGYLQPYLQNTSELPLILGGDFNVWSHLDWTEKTKDIHGGKVVPWWTTRQFENAGLKDSFREINPDPKKYPGISWGMPHKKDDHRIDYLLYKSKRLKTISSEIHKVDYNQPLKFRGKTYNYPSDHGFVWAKYKLIKK
ncbi:endonuclease/exonuclease/phosphatase family protein [Echinicola shivajiensis]|uniref:endonuclease/exonuclease/phosphatase family protein n=1 Tax=Echinicola shivajiensis TaxID=1035916 RepID=UPI001BFC4CE7|nr:endonuclease/exonuclease/phosphatase family protein [Echinicola shivajiensis]